MSTQMPALLRQFHTLKNMTAKIITRKNPFKGLPKESDYQIMEETLPPLKDGEFVAEASYLSVDPYQRAFASQIGKPVLAEQVAKIVESKNPKYPVGQYVVGEFGWRTRTIGDETVAPFSELAPRIIPDLLGNLPKSLLLGTLGMPGHTAYFGFLEICKPKEGDTVVVSGAGGAVGSHVGQIAKIKGCRVVGITGSDEKGQWLTKELGFDAYVNYKDPDFEQKLAEATPNRIDCYFDNVGGQISSIVLYRLNKFARVAICGAVSTYNSTEPVKATEVQTAIKIHHARMEGFHVTRFLSRYDESFKQNLDWIKQGKLKYNETVTEGFENTVRAFIEMLGGRNIGKAIVKL